MAYGTECRCRSKYVVNSNTIYRSKNVRKKEKNLYQSIRNQAQSGQSKHKPVVITQQLKALTIAQTC